MQEDGSGPAHPGTLVPRSELRRSDAALLDLAEEAAARARPIFSHFAVGAALRAEGGPRRYLGWNVEDQSLTRVLHAEQAAILAGLNHRGAPVRILDLAVWGRGDVPPCGACRQMIVDANPGARVLFPYRGRILIATAAELLPLQFRIDPDRPRPPVADRVPEECAMSGFGRRMKEYGPVLGTVYAVFWLSEHVSVSYWGAGRRRGDVQPRKANADWQAWFYGSYVVVWFIALLLILALAPVSGGWSLFFVGVVLYRLQDMILGTIGDAFDFNRAGGVWMHKVMLAIVNIAQIVMIFAFVFLVLTPERAFAPAPPLGRFGHFFLSWSTLPPLGSGFAAHTTRARVLVMLESAAGVLLTVIALSRFLGSDALGDPVAEAPAGAPAESAKGAPTDPGAGEPNPSTADQATGGVTGS